MLMADGWRLMAKSLNGDFLLKKRSESYGRIFC